MRNLDASRDPSVPRAPLTDEERLHTERADLRADQGRETTDAMVRVLTRQVPDGEREASLAFVERTTAAPLERLRIPVLIVGGDVRQ